jgi:hypothetical protein
MELAGLIGTCKMSARLDLHIGMKFQSERDVVPTIGADGP